MIRAGRTGGFCAQYAVVMVQACLALGWQARYVDLSPDYERGGGHLSVEVWSNLKNRWALLDPYYDGYFERAGGPLSALEIHDALARGQTGDISFITGRGKNAKANAEASREKLFGRFRCLAVDLRTDHLSRPCHFWDRRNGYLAWRDRFCGPDPGLFARSTNDPAEFNFPVNQVHVRLGLGQVPGELVCLIRTNMPDFNGLEIGLAGTWSLLPPPGAFTGKDSPLNTALDTIHGQVMTYHWKLAPGTNAIAFRAVNQTGIAGPATRLTAEYRPAP